MPINAAANNVWVKNAAELADAYIRHSGPVRFETVTRDLEPLIGRPPQRVVDIGGGYGMQAIMLARHGHEVIIVDCDKAMIAEALSRLEHEPAEVRDRVGIVEGYGRGASSLVGSGFDLVCCHSVLAYEEDPAPLLSELTALAQPGGLLSIVSINPDAAAMRLGLQQRWKETIATLSTDRRHDSRIIADFAHRRQRITELLAAFGATPIGWTGIGIFTDHPTEPICVEDPQEIYDAEWLAGRTDPYRQVARCYHLMLRMGGEG